ncbi:AAA family ATPase [Halomonas halocynthiae]|uniref:AAA family ATPase n=1 Tax=Halomonas halocynthiae TaxID=176290 RepID=UPI0004224F29|nr:bifunctional aminoglycoside phosphotransferase/ATP-binding protein [Halomonas halocynthiae]
MTQRDPKASPHQASANTQSLTLDSLIETLSEWQEHHATHSDSASQLLDSLARQITLCLGGLGDALQGDEDQRRLKALGGWLWESVERLTPQIETRAHRALPCSWARDHGDHRLIDDNQVLLAQAVGRVAEQCGIDACQDPAEDLASLLVGLKMAGRQELARDALDRYLRHSGDYPIARLLSFYLVLASLRAAWAALHQQTHEALGEMSPSSWMVEHLGLARGYLSLAEQYAEFRFPPLIIGVGVSGSGKSRFTRTLVTGLGAVRLTSYSERRRVSEFKNNPQQGESACPVDKYSPEITAATYQRLADCIGWLLDGGIPACVDSTSLTREQRRLLWQQAEKRGLPVLLVSFEADETTLRRRLGKRAVRLGMTEAECLALFDTQRQAFEPFDDEERLHLVRLDTTADNAAETLASLIKENVRFC